MCAAMKVLQVIDTLHIGGAEQVVITLTNLLRQKAVPTDVLLLVDSGPLEKKLNGAHVHHLNRTNKYSFAKLKETHNICRQYNIVHVHMRHCYAYIRLAQLVFNGKYKLIFQDHYGDININQQIPFGLKGIFKPINYIGVSPALVQWAKEKLNIAEAKCYLLHNTVMNTIGDHQAADNGKVMVVSNIRSTKNIEFAIDLFAGTAYQLTIYGNKENEQYYREVKASCKLRDVRIVEGQTNITSVYEGYDIAIHCSRSETGPLVLLEYMSQGLPFLAYKTGAVADVIANELPLYFINNFNKQEWLTRIKEISSVKDHSALVLAFQKYFSPESYINTCLQVYQNVSC
ncbi:MAG: glycosyltransferase [Sphingobacteriales bacterium]|nr:MAG: glycosyltransferase [Sphingobacteriales bacterium]